MSMKMLTALQLLEISSLYAVLTLLLPAILFYKKISSMRFSVRFMVYQTVGNFYMITLVFVLQLLHISNWYTLVGFTVLSFFAAYVHCYQRNPKVALQKFLEDLKKLAEGKYGLRLFIRRIRLRIFQAGKKFSVTVWKRLWKNLPDVLLLLALFAAYMLTYGRNAFQQYGYCTSDIVVHNYWINDMGKGKLFTAGVYPFGFHCVIYYLHTVFQIETYVLLRLFWVVQTLVIHLMLLAFIRICCKTKYTAYVGLGIYMLVQLFRINTYSRFISSLPQEFGMIFLLPSIAFLFLFFECKGTDMDVLKSKKQKKGKRRNVEQKEEAEEEEQEEEAILILEENAQDGSFRIRKIQMQENANIENGSMRKSIVKSDRNCYLLLFVLSFSLTLSIHFYNTMVAGVFCIGIAVGYCFRLFRRQYFGRVMLAGIASIGIALLPMLLAYLGGTPLEGSLYWGMDVLNGTAKQSADIQQTEEEEDGHFSLADVRNIMIIKNGNIISDGEIISRKGSFEGGRVLSKGDVTFGNHKIKDGQMVSDAKLLDDGKVVYDGLFIAVGYDLSEEDLAADTVSHRWTAIDRMKEKAERVIAATFRTMDSHLIFTECEWVSQMIPVCIVFLFFLSFLFFILRQTDYAARMLSTAAYMGMMTVIFVAPELGLPELMDASGRTCVYYAYSLIVLWCLCLDGILQLVFGKIWQGQVAQLLSFLVVPVLAVVVVSNHMVKNMYYTPQLQPNDAIVCLTNIIRDNQDETWTIVSANDELQMGEDHGYHYEMDEFLRKMEYKGDRSVVSIPTKKVYFFVEKVPIDYAEPYENSGQKISKKGAAHKLPSNSGIEMYKAESRWVEMSRLFFWAQQFQSMYPNEMDVYYETEDFVCYCVDQNEYSLFNFSIDYKYNRMRDVEE